MADQTILDSRYIGMVDVPECQQVEAKFVYHYFVPDERTNRAGVALFQGIKNEETQRAINTNTLETRLPRFIEVTFDPVNCGDAKIQDLEDQPILSDPAVRGKTDTEDTLTTERDSIYRFSDRSVRARLTTKARLLATQILGIDENDVPAQIKVLLEANDTIDQKELQKVLSPEDTPGVEYVNEIGVLGEPDIYTLAASLKLDMFLDRRLLKIHFGGDYTKESPLKSENYSIAKDDALSFLPSCQTDAAEDSFEPTFTVINKGEVDDPSDLIRTRTVGYVIERHEVSPAGQFIETKNYLIDDANSTNFLDTEIVYGSTYMYSVKTVALIERIVDSDGSENLPAGHHKVWSLISSRPSKQVIVEAVEHRPPLEPDGVFYRFNYDAGRGMIIRWQIPVGKQRDVKYFQIFRRKTIHDPFTCIAELDFDNSTITATRREKVNDDRVFKYKGAVTQFIDPEFTRDSSFIYAVVALDAHGLTSGYSAQTRVTFEKLKNTINLMTISKAGAPKQYPNFFVDPDLDDNIFVDSLTQDSMLASQKRKVHIYFDPDAVKFNSADGRSGDVVLSKNEKQGVYKLHLLNIDRQKSATLEIAIENLGSA